MGSRHLAATLLASWIVNCYRMRCLAGQPGYRGRRHRTVAFEAPLFVCRPRKRQGEIKVRCRLSLRFSDGAPQAVPHHLTHWAHLPHGKAFRIRSMSASLPLTKSLPGGRLLNAVISKLSDRVVPAESLGGQWVSTFFFHYFDRVYHF